MQVEFEAVCRPSSFRFHFQVHIICSSSFRFHFVFIFTGHTIRIRFHFVLRRCSRSLVVVSALPDCPYRVSFRKYRPLELPLSCEVVEERWFWTPNL